MSVQITKAVLRDFLGNSETNVLAMTGAWGTGKTYAWREALLTHKDSIKFKQYSYVSLFGISTMAELRTSIFTKSIAVATFGKKLDVATINKHWNSITKSWLKKTLERSAPILKSLPHGTSVALSLDALAAGAVRDTLVCFDDFERATINAADILGLITELSEERDCKVALIFNAEHLGAIEAYRAYREKVIEASIATAVLLCWCAYAPDPSKPKMDDIENSNKALISFKKEGEQDPYTLAWVQRLKAYGFMHVDDLDLAIARVVKCGYIEGTGFVELAKKLDEGLSNNEVYKAFTAVWTRFHDSFSDDQDAFIEELYDTAVQAIAHISSSDLNGTVGLLRELKRDDFADRLIDKFVVANTAKPSTFDLKNHPFGGTIDDIKLRATFDAAHTGLTQLPGLVEATTFMAKNSGYNPEHLEAMMKASVEEYQAMFLKKHEDVKLSNLVKWSLRWANTEHAEITAKATTALERIKATSLLNAIRVGRYGV
jgi:hypothetical protein